MAERRPLFSVVIPTYNRLPMVVEAIQCVLAQTCDDYEIIVVDDGSTDGTPAELESMFDERVSVIAQANGGVSSARNAGTAAARGSFIAYLDSDDLWEPQRLERIAAIIDELPIRPSFMFNDFRRFHMGRNSFWPETNTQLFPRIFNFYARYSSRVYVAEPRAALRCIIADYPFFPSTFIVAREVHEMVNWDTAVRYSEDFNFVGRIAQTWSMVYIDEPLTTVRLHDSNKSANWGAKLASHLGTLELLSRGADGDLRVAITRAKGRRHFQAARAFLQEGNVSAATGQLAAALGCPAWYLGGLMDLVRKPFRRSVGVA